MRARLDQSAARILACAGTTTAAVAARWDAVGIVHCSASGVLEPSVNDCVAVAVGRIDVPSGGAPGNLLHPLGE